MNTQSFPLHEAARDGNVLIVKGIVSQSPKSVLTKDLDDKTPLHWAVAFGHLEVASILLNPTKFQKSSDRQVVKPFEIDIDDYLDASNWTALHVAASVGNVEVLLLLLNHKPEPDVNLTTGSGLTPLHLATSKKHIDVVKELVEIRGASVRIKDKQSQIPLHRAAAVGSLGLVQYLVEVGKSPLNVRDIYGWTPLHHALAEGFGDVAVFLVKSGADYKIEDNDGLTPLKVAVDEKVSKYFKAELVALGVELQHPLPSHVSPY